MNDLHRLLDWKLLKGSHKFPGPDGGTCINEAAVVVAGFDYRSIRSAADCPPCFSRPISAYAIYINDYIPDRLRQRLLLPFVTRLAGSADAPEVERRRADLIMIRTCHKILVPSVFEMGLHKQAAAHARVTTFDEAFEAALDTRAAMATMAALDTMVATATTAALAAMVATATTAALAAAAAMAATAAAAAMATLAALDTMATTATTTALAAMATTAVISDRYWLPTAEILDEALSIGKQAEPIETAIIIARADAAKRRAAERVT